jgi:alpha-L-fucosidase
MTTNEQDTAPAAQHALLGIEQTKPAFQRTSHPDAQWFGDAGLGLFIHWGISAVHGKIDISWSMMANTPWDAIHENRNKITPAEYFRLAERFSPAHYDPDKWLAPAARAGFRYAVLTTRHHDGFALWPSAHGEFSTRTHLNGRDLVQPYVDACRRHGLKVGLYYSPPDWYYHRDYDSFHYGAMMNGGGGSQRPHFDVHHQPCHPPPKPEGWEEGYHEYIRLQVIELLTRYAPVDLLWFDGGPAAMPLDEIRALQPGIVVNPRMHGYGDFLTPEAVMPTTPPEGWWELCDLWPECGWGYETPGGEHYKSLDWMLGRLRQVRQWNGNYLINVSPRADGSLPDAYYARLRELSDLGGFSTLDAQWRGTRVNP